MSDNPIRRLQEILIEAQRHPPKIKASEVWADVFEVKPSESDEVLRLYAELMKLTATSRGLLRQLSESSERFDSRPCERHIMDVQKALAYTQFQANWEHVRN